MSLWYKESVFYHIYPLGFCGAPELNDFSGKIENRLEKIDLWIDHIKSLGVNAIYLGPIFQSGTHGYDTVDYYLVDERLGGNNTLKQLVKKIHVNGIKVVLDGVFNHVSRDFFAFKDLQKRGRDSKYVNWFQGLDFNKMSPLGDNFIYNNWRGHCNLVQLNLNNSELLDYLFGAVKMWIQEFNIDGLRLDVADVLDFGFMKKLSVYTKSLKEDFWLMGEVIHGDYSKWIEFAQLDSTTNYECYKGMFSSFNDKNFFEIAYSLNRLFNVKDGLYRDLDLYNFVDNHDVNRIYSTLDYPGHIYPLHILLFTIPGVPSLYYGSEWGIEGVKSDNSDRDLRPKLDLDSLCKNIGYDLIKTIQKLSYIWNFSKALKLGTYQELFVDSEQFVFKRRYKDEVYLVFINSSMEDKLLTLKVNNSKYIDLLNNNETFTSFNGYIEINLYSNWGRILKEI